MKKLLTLFTLLLTVCSGAWATAGDSASDPATKTLNGQVFLDVANTPYNATITSGTIRCVTYGIYYLCAATSNGWRPSWVGGSTNNMSASTSSGNADFSAQGFLPGAQSSSSTAAERAVASGYGYSTAKQADNNTRYIYVTGITGVAMLNKDDSNESRNCILKVEEYNQAGTATTDLGTTTSGNNTSYHVTEYDAATLSGDKYYKITLSGSSSSGGCGQESQIRFIQYQTPSTPTLSVAETPSTFTYDLNEGTGPSDAQTFTVSLANSEEKISATLSNKTDYEMKTGEGEWGTADLTTLSSGDEVQVRLKSGLSVGEHNGKLTFTSDGADDLELDLTGSVTNTVAITLAWNKSSDIVATNSVVTAPVFSNNGGLEVNTTNFNFAVTGTDGIISVDANGIVTINSSKEGEATVTASVIATGYSADPVAYTIRVADAATKWDFTNFSGKLDDYLLQADVAKESDNVWVYSKNNTDRFAIKNDIVNAALTANGVELSVAEGLKFTATASNLRLDKESSNKRMWLGTNAVITIPNCKKGQMVTVNFKNSGNSGTRSLTLTNLAGGNVVDGKWTVGTTADDFTGYVSANGDVTMTVETGLNIYTISVNEATTQTGTITASGWNTFSSSYALDLSTISDGTIAYVAASTSGSDVTLTPVDKIVAAGTGLMINGTAGETFTINTTSADATFKGDNLLVGMPNGGTVAVAGEGFNYVFGWTNPAEPGFYLIDGDIPTLGANKAYLHTATTPSGKLNIIIDDSTSQEEETDGIKAVSTKVENGVRYNLAGQRVGKDYKGIVIVNGKKMLNK